MKSTVWIAAAAAAFTAVPAAYAAQSDYPNRPVRMIVPFAPGGASDHVARIIQPRMVELLGQPVVVENRAGAAGNIGVELAARASPDGYTFLLGNVGTMAINPNMFPTFPVKALRDLIGITEVVDVPGSLVVHPSLPVKTTKELIAYLKANPGKLNYGTPGPGSANRLETEIFQIMTATKMVHVPYKGGAGPAMTGLVSGEVQVAFVTFSSSITFAKSGRLRMLGVVAPDRVPAMPEVPTMKEQGFPTMTVGSWQGVFVPKGTPQNVQKKLFDVSQETMKNAEVQKRLADGGINVVLSDNPAAFRKFWEAENQRFGKVIKDAKIPTE
ncbi:MAG TPA: tripartite tricarboxylate transporter substrate binding protein [Burkholderiales bacterium]|nr:tripartite tricarboxylate transporter substrate binding protein [Burkholderiales bacterium]